MADAPIRYVKKSSIVCLMALLSRLLISTLFVAVNEINAGNDQSLRFWWLEFGK
jgi:hypothetical protein